MKGRSEMASVGTSLVCGALLAIAVNQVPSYLAYCSLESLEWRETATPDDVRAAAHRALGSWFASPHDAFLALSAHGDRSSIPYLRAALSRQPEGDPECTWSHGRE